MFTERWGRLICLAVVAAAVLTPPAAAAAAADPTIALVGSGDPRAVDLRFESGRPPTMAGSLRFAVRSTFKDGPVEVRIRYAPGSGPIETVTGASTPARLATPTKAGSDRVTIGPSRTRQIQVDFTLNAAVQPQALDGDLLVEAFKAGVKDAQAQLSVAVTGRVKPVGDVRVEPAKAIIETDRGCITFGVFSCPVDEGGDVRLVGTGVSALLDDLAAAGRGDGWVDATRADGEVVRVWLRDLEGVGPQTATGRLELAGNPTPGKYTGALPLSPIDPKSPAISIDVRSHLWVGWAIVAILAGVFLAWLFLHQLALRRRRDLIQGWLEARAQDYQNIVALNDLGSGKTLLTSLSIRTPLAEDPDWTYSDDLGTPESILSALRWARNDADLDETQTATGKLSVEIATWRFALLQARRLWDATSAPHADRSTGGSGQSGAWADTRTAIDSHVVLHLLHDGTLSSHLIEIADRQARWHGAYGEAWDLYVRLQSNPANNTDLNAIPFNSVEGEDFVLVLARTAEQQAVIDERLGRIRLALEKLDGRSLADATAATVQTRPAEIEVARRDLDAARLFAATPAAAVTQVAVNRGMGIALAGSPAMDLTTTPPPAAVGDVAAPDAPGTGSRRHNRRTRLLHWLKFLDIAQSLVIVLLTAAAYFFAKYDDSWGSVADVATAVAAGFGGQIAIKWAVLPIYRSIRLRATAAAETPAAI